MADPLRLPLQAQAVEFTLTIPAGKTERINHPGTFVRVRSANRSFTLQLGSGPPFGLNPGSQYTCPEGTSYPWIVVGNPTADALVITLVVGQGDIRSDSVQQPPPPTVFLASATASIGAGAGVTFDGVPTANRNQRKLFVVSNKDPAVAIEIRDSPGAVAGVNVRAGDTIALEVSGPLTVFNPTGAPVAVAMGEVWFINA